MRNSRRSFLGALAAVPFAVLSAKRAGTAPPVTATLRRRVGPVPAPELRGITYFGKPIILDPECAPSRIYYLNPDHFHMIQYPPGQYYATR